MLYHRAMLLFRRDRRNSAASTGWETGTGRKSIVVSLLLGTRHSAHAEGVRNSNRECFSAPCCSCHVSTLGPVVCAPQNRLLGTSTRSDAKVFPPRVPRDDGRLHMLILDALVPAGSTAGH